MHEFNVRSPMSIEEADAIFNGKRLLYEDIQRYGIKLLKEDCAVYCEGKLVLMLIRDALPAGLINSTFPYLRRVSGDPSSRPSVFGKGARVNRIREDGLLSPRIATSKELVKTVGGKADFLGFYRYKNKAKGVPDCKRTGWTKSHPDIYDGTIPFIQRVDEVYRTCAPEPYARQVEYLKTIPEWRIGKTAFTTLYVIKNLPTACHRDEMDIPEGFGVMATMGQFRGAEFCIPRFRVAVDYQPGDVLLANVHELHGNFPLLEGERVTSVFFVRQGMHECPGLQEPAKR